MNAISYTERNMVESYATVINNLSVPGRIELMERLLKSLKRESEESLLPEDEFIPEKTAEQIISELRESRSFGKTRVIMPL